MLINMHVPLGACVCVYISGVSMDTADATSSANVIGDCMSIVNSAAIDQLDSTVDRFHITDKDSRKYLFVEINQPVKKIDADEQIVRQDLQKAKLNLSRVVVERNSLKKSLNQCRRKVEQAQQEAEKGDWVDRKKNAELDKSRLLKDKESLQAESDKAAKEAKDAQSAVLMVEIQLRQLQVYICEDELKSSNSTDPVEVASVREACAEKRRKESELNADRESKYQVYLKKDELKVDLVIRLEKVSQDLEANCKAIDEAQQNIQASKDKLDALSAEMDKLEVRMKELTTERKNYNLEIINKEEEFLRIHFCRQLAKQEEKRQRWSSEDFDSGSESPEPPSPLAITAAGETMDGVELSVPAIAPAVNEVHQAPPMLTSSSVSANGSAQSEPLKTPPCTGVDLSMNRQSKPVAPAGTSTLVPAAFAQYSEDIQLVEISTAVQFFAQLPDGKKFNTNDVTELSQEIVKGAGLYHAFKHEQNKKGHPFNIYDGNVNLRTYAIYARNFIMPFHRLFCLKHTQSFTQLVELALQKAQQTNWTNMDLNRFPEYVKWMSRLLRESVEFGNRNKDCVMFNPVSPAVAPRPTRIEYSPSGPSSMPTFTLHYAQSQESPTEGVIPVGRPSPAAVPTPAVRNDAIEGHVVPRSWAAANPDYNAGYQTNAVPAAQVQVQQQLQTQQHQLQSQLQMQTQQQQLQQQQARQQPQQQQQLYQQQQLNQRSLMNATPWPQQHLTAQHQLPPTIQQPRLAAQYSSMAQQQQQQSYQQYQQKNAFPQVTGQLQQNHRPMVVQQQQQHVGGVIQSAEYSSTSRQNGARYANPTLGVIRQQVAIPVDQISPHHLSNQMVQHVTLSGAAPPPYPESVAAKRNVRKSRSSSSEQQRSIAQQQQVAQTTIVQQQIVQQQQSSQFQQATYKCLKCGSDAEQTCSGCQTTYYCSRECQVLVSM